MILHKELKGRVEKFKHMKLEVTQLIKHKFKISEWESYAAELSLGHLQVHVRSVTESHMKRYGYVLFSRSSGPGLSLH